MRKTLTGIAIAGALLFSSVVPTFGYSPKIQISQLPEYTRDDNFYISYSALSQGSVSVQFCYKKEGDSYQTFGSVMHEPSGQVFVDHAQIQEQAKYYFRAYLNGSGCSGTASNETSTTYDISGPSPVSGYYKEFVADGHLRLHWKNPGDSDFSRVFIYRSTDSSNFTADGSTKVAEVGGAPDQEMTWDNTGLDATKEYFYAVRAIDKAGNPSSLVGDPELTATVDQGTTTNQQEGTVQVLPQTQSQNQGGGQVLGEEQEATPSPTATPTPSSLSDSYNQAKQTLFGTTKGKLILVGALLLGALSYFIWRRR